MYTPDCKTPQETELWVTISTFTFDEPDTRYTFAQRLSDEYGWKAAYAGRVLAEYRKFLFLCCVSLFDVAPSEAVDQVWQLHLTCTRSYWLDLCRDTIEGELHHYPGKAGYVCCGKLAGAAGGRSYSMSKTPYEDYFGTPPPADIWPDYQFEKSATRWQRVNRRQYWVIPKPTVRQWDFIWNVLFFAGSYRLWDLTGGWQAEHAVGWGVACLTLFIWASGNLSARRYTRRARRHIHYNAMSARYWADR